MKPKYASILSLFFIILLSASPYSWAESPASTDFREHEDNREYDEFQNTERPPTFPDQHPRIDIVFVIDTTGSMADEIREVKAHLIDLSEEIMRGEPRPEVRVGLVSYRDFPPEEREYVVQEFDLTHDTQTMLEHLQELEARGGGDLPEAVATGLDTALRKMAWDDDAKKMMFLIGDAAPHSEGSTDVSFEQSTPDGLNYRDAIALAQRKDIAIYTVSGSGIDEVGVRIWKEIATETGGAYERLTYERRDADTYFVEAGIAPERAAGYAADAKLDRDFDAKSNTILTNSLGRFARASVMAEAEGMGVSYNEGTNTLEQEESHNNTHGFFSRLIRRITFWD